MTETEELILTPSANSSPRGGCLSILVAIIIVTTSLIL